MSAEEYARARAIVSTMALPIAEVRTRRREPHAFGGRIDPRATLRAGLRTGSGMILPKFTAPRRKPPPVIVLCDISGSMEPYARIFLHFMHGLANGKRRFHGFVFGTRLTNLTRTLKNRDPDVALANVSNTVQDWSGGTRIGHCLADFNRLWSRRVLTQGPLVLLMTDGLDQAPDEMLAAKWNGCTNPAAGWYGSTRYCAGTDSSRARRASRRSCRMWMSSGPCTISIVSKTWPRLCLKRRALTIWNPARGRVFWRRRRCLRRRNPRHAQINHFAEALCVGPAGSLYLTA